MTKRISSISPLQAGIVYAALTACVSIVIIVPAMLLVSVVGIGAHTAGTASGSNNPAALMLGGGLAMAIIIPIIYTILGFVMGVVGALIYNLIAKITGGIELTFTDPAGTTSF